MAEPVLGIDLGTSVYRVAAAGGDFQEETAPRLLAFGGKPLVLPSVVALGAAREWLAGDEAERVAAVNPGAAIFGAKALLGLDFTRAGAVSSSRAEWGGPAPLAGPDGTALLNLSGYGPFAGTTTAVWPSRAVVEILRQAKAAASSALGVPVNLCVIGVPSRFGPAERQFITQAARLAGLDVLNLIEESLAVALARQPVPSRSSGGTEGPKDENLLVADVGAGFTSLTALSRRGSRYRILASSTVGQAGDDLDNRVARWLLSEFSKQPAWPAKPTPRLLTRILGMARAAKETLSSQDSFAAVLPFRGRTYTVLVTRSQIERFAADLVSQLTQEVRRLWGECERVLRGKGSAAGGPTLIPAGRQGSAGYITRALQEALADARVEKAPPDGAVALGAAIWARALLARHPLEAGSEETPRRRGRGPSAADRPLLARTAPWSLLAKDAAGMATLVRVGTTLPCEARMARVSTTEDNQTKAVLRLALSPGVDPDDCRAIGEVRLEGIPPAPAGVPDIALSFALAGDARLQVRARTGDGQPIEATLHYYGEPRDSDIVSETAGLGEVSA